MYLQGSQRVLKVQSHLQHILTGLWGENGNRLAECDIQILATNFHLMNQGFSPRERNKICKYALFLFEPKEFLSQQKLRECYGPSNLVRKIKVHTFGFGDRRVSNNRHYDSESVPPMVSLCVGCKVSLIGHNICPEWVVFNGSVGIVKDIIFKKGESPNSGHLPLYILVDFALSKGPVFDPKNHCLVPIVPITVPCNLSKCPCRRTFAPLKLSYSKAKTLVMCKKDSRQTPCRQLFVIQEPDNLTIRTLGSFIPFYLG